MMAGILGLCIDLSLKITGVHPPGKSQEKKNKLRWEKAQSHNANGFADNEKQGGKNYGNDRTTQPYSNEL